MLQLYLKRDTFNWVQESDYLKTLVLVIDIIYLFSYVITFLIKLNFTYKVLLFSFSELLEVFPPSSSF